MAMRLLYADDDPDDVEMFLEVASELSPGIEVMTAIDGVEAFNTLSASDKIPDLIFLDINMPRMDGIQCLKKIRTHPKMQKIPVVMYSTSLNDKHKEIIEEYRADFLGKSTSLGELRAGLSKYLK